MLMDDYTDTSHCLTILDQILVTDIVVTIYLMDDYTDIVIVYLFYVDGRLYRYSHCLTILMLMDHYTDIVIV